MTVVDVVRSLDYGDIVLCFAATASLLWARETRKYSFLAAFLGIRAVSSIVECLLSAVGYHFLGKHLAYVFYFYTYWTAFAVQSIFMLGVVYSMYRLAMAPLKGLQNLGMLVFRWVAGISIVVALASAFSPHLSALQYMLAFVSQMQRTQSILVLCLLLFVTFAIRPMGLSYRSRIFGVSLGLGVMATTDLVQSAWVGHVANMYGMISIVHGFAVCLALFTWSLYFALPEPKRRLITLPTTSPFLRWNQIAEALGDDPGHVAIGGLPPDMLAPAEIEVMRRASVKMKIGWQEQSKLAEQNVTVDVA